MKSGALTIAVVALVAACGPSPQPIAYGIDVCDACHMSITDPRFGAEAVSVTGKVWTFDSVEELAAFALQPREGMTIHSLWVSDFSLGVRGLVPVEQASFLVSDALRSPMGLGIAAFASEEARDAARLELGGRGEDWDRVVSFVERAWPGGRPTLGASGDPDHGHRESHSEGGARQRLTVSPHGPVRTIQEAVSTAAPGAVITVDPGVYREESRIIIDRPLTLVGRGDARLDGSLSGQILEVRADSVTVRGLTFQNVSPSFVEDRSALKVEDASGCTIENNRFLSTFFGIYLANASGCRISGNVLVADQANQNASGNGIHLWYSTGVEVVGNQIRGHRDGIYFEFVEGSHVEQNVSQANLRYGLHFMFSDDCTYRSNHFVENGAGVAVMYTERVVMEDNDFSHNWGSAAFGLLLKDIRDSRIQGNRFLANSVGLYAEGANRLQVIGNDFRENGWAVKVMADTEGAEFTANNFFANSFDLATNSRRTWSRFDGNYWDDYRGYDLDRDGVGDVPYRPVKLFTILVEQNEPLLALLRSPLSQLLDLAEVVLPVLTPDALRDNQPAMKPQPSRWVES